MKEAIDNYDNFMKNAKMIPKEEKPLRVVYIDMNKKKRVKNKELEEELSKQDSAQKNESEEIKGKNDKFPVENFIKLEVLQYNKKINLSTYKYESKQTYRNGIVILMHGLYEYSNRNAYVAKIMAEKGFDVLAFDLRGHGKSDGIRGFFENINTLIEDTETFLNEINKIYPPETPKFLFGYSFGCVLSNLISLKLANSFQGIVLIAPPFNHNFDKYKSWIKLGYFLGKFFPTLKLVKIKEKPTENKAVLNWIMNDPLIYRGKIRIGTGITIIEGQKEASLRAKEIHTPIYILHGKDDRITNYKGSEKFFNDVPIKDKTIFIADDLDHDVMRHQQIERYIGDICFWMEQRLKVKTNKI